MLSFLTPGLWIGLLGLLIPLAIHLWNRRKGRTIKVGSIEWFDEAEQKKWSSLKLSEWLRLLLRMVLLGCFVLLLVQPIWKNQAATQQKRKWALIGQDYFDHPNLPTIADSLQQLGYEIRAFSRQFPLLEKPIIAEKPENYWSLLKALEVQSTPPDSLLIIAYPRQEYFKGKRPEFSIPVQWKSLPLRHPAFFLAEAWQSPGNINFILGKSEEQQTTYQRHSIPFDQQEKNLDFEGLPPLKINQNLPEQHWQIQFASRPGSAIDVKDSLQIQACILYDAPFADDKAYLEAGLHAVGSYLDVKIDIETLPTTASLFTSDGWLFWLSERPLADSLHVAFAPHLAIFSPHLISGKAYFEKAKGYYQMNKRLDGKNVLNNNPQLPHDLLTILFEPGQQSIESKERHTLAIAQVLPVFDNQNDALRADGTSSSKSLYFVVWIALVLLFLWERML